MVDQIELDVSEVGAEEAELDAGDFPKNCNGFLDEWNNASQMALKAGAMLLSLAAIALF